MRLVFLLLFLLATPLILASCKDSQIDLNTAPKEKLDELSGIGLSKAETIIDSRPFYTLDDLLEVSGIGEATLQKIKDQGLACIGDKDNHLDESPEIPLEDVSVREIPKELEQPVTQQPIILNPKNIKSTNFSQDLNKTYATYGLIGFCGLLGVLFLFKHKRRRKQYKNEFRE